ncbi:MAG: lytic transglycosylase domain-containing protein [Acidiferrobacterales bacterium]
MRKMVLLFGLAAFSMPAFADLFIYQTPDGSRMLTDHLLSDPSYRLIRSGQAARGAGVILAGKNRQFFRTNPKAYDKLIARMAKAHDVDSGLIKAVIYVESRFNPYATSSKGAAGLMQLMPATADEYGVDNVYDPAQNIEAGVLHLKYLLKRYRNKKLAIAAYNAGQTNVDRFRGIPPYSETRKYVKRVLRYSKIYKVEFQRDS